MKSLFPWGRARAYQDIKELEASLRSTLIPVLPQANFIDGLKERLLYHSQEGTSRGPRSDALQIFVAVIAGIASGTLLMITSLRVMITLLATLGILHQANRQIKEKRQPARARLR